MSLQASSDLSQAESARHGNWRTAGTLNSLVALTNAGLLEDGISAIVKARHWPQTEPSQLSIYVGSLNISHDDLVPALTVIHPCPETQRRFNARRDALARDTQLTDYDHAIEMAKQAGDSELEKRATLQKDLSVKRSAGAWARLVRVTLGDCMEWQDQQNMLAATTLVSDKETSNVAHNE